MSRSRPGSWTSRSSTSSSTSAAQSFGEAGNDRERWKAGSRWTRRRSRSARSPAPTCSARCGSSRSGSSWPGVRCRWARWPRSSCAPRRAGRGVAKSLLASALDWMRDRGLVVSSLHPASTRVYRSMGWEHAGRAGWAQVPTRSLAALGPAGERVVTRIDAGGNDEVRACFASDAIGRHGPVQRSRAWWDFLEAVADAGGAFTYGARGPKGALLGYVRYTQIPSRSVGLRHPRGRLRRAGP